MPLTLPPFSLGGNVFGWTADETESFAVLDAARDAGIHFIDTADVYSAWAHSGVGGQSETVIGNWLASRGGRDQTVIATKVGKDASASDIRPETVRRALDASLTRLQIDVVDLYYVHEDDGGGLLETIATYDALIRDGKIRAWGLSQTPAARVREVAEIAAREGLAAPIVVQDQYSLVERGYEDELRGAVADAGLGFIPFWGLASGFLTGKYRPGAVDSGSPRAGSAAAYLDDPRGARVLEALDAVAETHDAAVASVALAWLAAQPTVVSLLASARTPEQVAPLAAATQLTLTTEELSALTAASQTPATA